MIASLPMYDRPETRAAWNTLWSAATKEYRRRQETARQTLPDLPDALSWDANEADHWLRDDLVLSQTCSLPYRTRLHGKVTFLGTFDFGLPGCAPGYYASVLVMRRDDMRHDPQNWPSLTLAYNAPDSQSGWAAPYFHLEARGLAFSNGVETGAHSASAKAVAEGQADIAAIDAQTFRLLRRYEPLMDRLVEIGQTDPTPGLPLITRPGWDASTFWASLSQAIRDMPGADRATLDLNGVTACRVERYTELPVPPPPEAVFA
ncbi:PhnD/SsuA/transferrin family substrate-binding protein [uncultured Litoreibacter sp.]|uniref:phosphate/phosphite/phosphonate ABC transporter substrate-binding protein n=1 Tax=uncultured Litoreibacter sp. TaxID=1392394 RepID=UPI002629EBE1|nr:PhnD/SsuA/transferrin family substrate-binding protein [uncultured Litoreibacter sp.]